MAVQLTSLDYQQIRRLMARSSELEQHMRSRLSEAAAYAKSVSPPPTGEAPHYRDSFGVELHQFPDGVPVGTLHNSHRLWAVIEKGSADVNRPQGGYSMPQRVLERALAYLQSTR